MQIAIELLKPLQNITIHEVDGEIGFTTTFPDGTTADVFVGAPIDPGYVISLVKPALIRLVCEKIYAPAKS